MIWFFYACTGTGSILNSKLEFDRCKIPRLVLEEQDEEEIQKVEDKEMEKDREAIEEKARLWGEKKTTERREDDLREWASQALSALHTGITRV